MAFREISVEQLKDNPFTLINKDWMLITAGDGEKHNTMTASWGGVGELWGKYVSTIYIRPQRYTLEFVEREEPLAVGADIIAGSLIKTPGGGIAPTGGYIAGRRDLVGL